MRGISTTRMVANAAQIVFDTIIIVYTLIFYEIVIVASQMKRCVSQFWCYRGEFGTPGRLLDENAAFP